ncbi:hypothetical protein LCGC14_2984390 [marine sediment metagenome]|uniref:Uncharacterized protein n=1 Tax=marine sediment metagenome TaxID=412755 RepID=A0A0F8XT90_9ZZZZ
MMKGWKVIDKERRTSALTAIGYGGIIYLLNKKARPLNGYGPLAVFKSKEDATRFACRDRLIAVECLYKKSNLCYLQDISGRKSDISYLPIGTDFASEVTCLE